MFGFKGKRSLFPTEEYKDEDAESLLSGSDNPQDPLTRSSNSIALRTILALIASHLATAVFVAWLVANWSLNLDHLCAAHTSQYSPILKDVDIKYETVRYNGSFFHETVYRGDASPEVDKAWTDLGVDYRAMLIPEEETEESGITKDHVRINPEYARGAPANLQGLHNLHCLNLLRQSFHWNYDYYVKLGKGPFANEEKILKVHTTHCLDMLRQRLMCEVDTGVLGQVWWAAGEGQSANAFVDFNVNHRCKNYDAIRAWAEARQLPEPESLPPDYLQGPTGLVYGEIP